MRRAQRRTNAPPFAKLARNRKLNSLRPSRNAGRTSRAGRPDASPSDTNVEQRPDQTSSLFLREFSRVSIERSFLDSRETGIASRAESNRARLKAVFATARLLPAHRGRSRDWNLPRERE